MKQGSGKGCTALTLKGVRCRNPTRWSPDPYLTTTTCRIHQQLEPEWSYELAQMKYRKALETRKMVESLPPLKVTTSVS